ncbi:hypothetical protein ANA_C20147 [Anabaena sp. 90]|nr:hypothetical protein ANA_C20147 [Anabaena sp. 90]
MRSAWSRLFRSSQGSRKQTLRLSCSEKSTQGLHLTMTMANATLRDERTCLFYETLRKGEIRKQVSVNREGIQ